MRLTVTAFMTLDGVAQGPGGTDEDPSDGFEYGGWLPAYTDDEFGRAVVDWFTGADAFLIGRRTYELFSWYWPQVSDPDDPVATKLNTLPKYVASRALGKLEWTNATVLDGDIAEAVRKLKAQPGNELQVHGSLELVQTLIANDLVDEYRLFVAPVILGTGKRLFQNIVPTALELVDSRQTGTGLMIQTYRPVGAPTFTSLESPK